MFNLFDTNASSVSKSDTNEKSSTSSGITQQTSSITNGRIDFASQAKPYSMYSDVDTKSNKKDFGKEAMRGALISNPLSEIYFSDVNFEALQGAIRYRVYVESDKKYKIGRQSDTELQIVMRSIYYQYSKNLPFDITGQVKVLNKKILDFVVPRIIQEINQYYQYKKDVSSLPVPLPRSESVSNAGSKFLYRGEF
jgi:hypothetical protein